MKKRKKEKEVVFGPGDKFVFCVVAATIIGLVLNFVSEKIPYVYIIYGIMVLILTELFFWLDNSKLEKNITPMEKAVEFKVMFFIASLLVSWGLLGYARLGKLIYRIFDWKVVLTFAGQLILVLLAIAVGVGVLYLYIYLNSLKYKKQHIINLEKIKLEKEKKKKAKKVKQNERTKKSRNRS